MYQQHNHRVIAVKALRYNLPIIYDSLLEIFESINDNIVKHTAHSIAEKIANYKFILSVLYWYDILQRILFQNLCNRIKLIHLNVYP